MRRRIATTLAALACVAAMGTAGSANAQSDSRYERPEKIRYVEGTLIPKGYVLKDHYRAGLWLTGALLVGLPYGLGAMAVLDEGVKADEAALFVPVFGPWIMISQQDDCGDNCLDSAGLNVLLVFDGLMQVTGAALIGAGLAFPVKMLVRDDLASLHVVPSRIGVGGYGLSAVGTF
jgi:hypothetical protein